MSIAARLILLAIGILSIVPLGARDPSTLSNALLPPGAGALWGTDILGRSVLLESLFGLQASIRIATVVSLISAIVGVGIGIFAARATWYAAVLSRVIDIALAMPGLLIALVLTAMLGPEIQNLVLAFVLLGWTGYAKVMRGEALRIRSLDFVAAAKVTGVSSWRIDLDHVFPQLLNLLVVQLCFGFGAVMLGESTLAYLGLGDPTLPTLGKQISEGVDYMRDHPHLVSFPGVVLAALILLLNWLGDQLQSARDLRGS